MSCRSADRSVFVVLVVFVVAFVIDTFAKASGRLDTLCDCPWLEVPDVLIVRFVIVIVILGEKGTFLECLLPS